ncbi:cell division protein SepF [Dactylosporangium sp. CA-139066]|uniref:cell division protein SepF n=1 Tax=Dactylosporangium sp. CA-139066 TaxID=3239930 RepID=UPI003D93EB91
MTEVRIASGGINAKSFAGRVAGVVAGDWASDDVPDVGPKIVIGRYPFLRRVVDVVAGDWVGDSPDVYVKSHEADSDSGTGGHRRDSTASRHEASLPEEFLPAEVSRVLEQEHDFPRRLKPVGYGDAAEVANVVLQNVPVILDLSEVSDVDAKRLVDFAAGLTRGVRGVFRRFSSREFLLLPGPEVPIAPGRVSRLVWRAGDPLLFDLPSVVPQQDYSRRAAASLIDEARRARWGSELERAITPLPDDLRRAVASYLRAIPLPDVAQPPDPRPNSVKRTLTEKERLLARHLISGLTNAQIARRMSLSPHTVNYLLRSLLRKFGVTGRAALVRQLTSAGEGIEVRRTTVRPEVF